MHWAYLEESIMKANGSAIHLAFVFCAASTAWGQGVVNITADVPDVGIERVLAAGEIIPITLWIDSDAGVPLFGVDFEVAADTDDLRIAAVAFTPDFPEGLGGDNPDLPADRFRAVRLQQPRGLDRSLGADGAPVPFAVIDVEVLNGGPFNSALTLGATGALVGQLSTGTTVLGNRPKDRGPTAARIPIRNTAAAPTPFPAPDREPWTTSTAPLTLQVRSLGGRTPLTTLEPYTTYELHYLAGSGDVTGYVLFAIGPAGEDCLASAIPPPSGEWSNSGLFLAADVEWLMGYAVPADGYPDGFNRYYLVTDELPNESDVPAGSRGHLCDFTTGPPGTLDLHLMVWSSDFEARHLVDMQEEAQYMVDWPATD